MGGGERSGNDPFIGRILDGRYRVQAKIGEGGMAVVYRGVQLVVDRPVAIKVVRPDWGLDARIVRRFEREARVVAHLRSPHVVRLFDVGRMGERQVYLVMELLRGEPLSRRLAREGPQPPARVLWWVEQVACALEEAHAAGIVHRDIKPDNVFVAPVPGDPNFLKVVDFGIAKLVAAATSDLTTTHGFVATPRYVAPEQLKSPREVDGRTDLYALGVLAYEALCGKPPFTGSALELMYKHAYEAPRPLRTHVACERLSPAIEAFVLEMLAKAPADRPAGAREVARRAAALRRMLEAESPRTARREDSSGFVEPTRPLQRGSDHRAPPAPSGRGASTPAGGSEARGRSGPRGTVVEVGTAQRPPPAPTRPKLSAEKLGSVATPARPVEAVPTRPERACGTPGRHSSRGRSDGLRRPESTGEVQASPGTRHARRLASLSTALWGAGIALLGILAGLAWERGGGNPQARRHAKSRQPVVSQVADIFSEHPDGDIRADANCESPDVPAALSQGDADAGTEPINADCGPGFVYVPPGQFVMGSPPEELGRDDDEGPQHRVALTRGLCVEQTEVTQRAFARRMGYNPSRHRDCGGDCPVDSVTWWDALAYANALSRAEGFPPCYQLHGCRIVGGRGRHCRSVEVLTPGGNPYECGGYRLPTEAEWEYAYRAGTRTALYAGRISAREGDDPVLDAMGWYRVNSGMQPHPVARKAPNAFGLYDMAGNVWEWCWDWYRSEYYANSPEQDPLGPASSEPVRYPNGRVATDNRVNRGGSWDGYARYARAANRYRVRAESRIGNLGFRLVRTVRR